MSFQKIFNWRGRREVIIFFLGLVAIGVFGGAIWIMHRSLVPDQHRQSVTVRGVLSSVSSDPPLILVGAWYRDSAATRFSIVSSTLFVDGRGSLGGISGLVPGFSVLVRGYVKDGALIADSVAVTDEPPIIVYNPPPGAVVGHLLTVNGIARVFENQFSIELDTASGSAIVGAHVYARAADAGQYGNFSATFPIPASMANKHLTVRAFDASLRDGSELGEIRVPVVIGTSTAAGQETSADVFWSMASNGNNCGIVFPAARAFSSTSSIARATIASLLSGPTDAERAMGYFSAIPEAVRLQKIVINNGVAFVDFNEALNQVGGSCRVAAIASQITNTLLQFPSVKKVAISIDGRTGDILQP